MHSIKEHTFVGGQIHNDVGAVDNWLQCQSLLQVLYLRWLTEESVCTCTAVGSQPVSGDE